MMAMLFHEERGMEVAARIWKGFEKASRGYEIVQDEDREAEEGGWRVGLRESWRRSSWRRSSNMGSMSYS